jgi:tetratricopeptide (TPR) repeat protein
MRRNSIYCIAVLVSLIIIIAGCQPPPPSETRVQTSSKPADTTVNEDNETLVLKEEAIKLMNARKFDEALKVINKAVEIDPRDDLLTKRADIYISTKKFDEAEKDLKEALKVSERADRKALIYGHMADVYNATGEDDKSLEAAREFEKLESELPSDAFKELYSVYGTLGTIFADAGEYNKAINAFNKALENEPARNRLLFERGYAYYKTGDEAKAKADIKAWLKTKPGDEKHLLRTMANAYMILEEYDTALKYINEAMAAEPNEYSFYNDRAYIYILQGKTDAAKKDLELVKEKHPVDHWETKMANDLLKKIKN